MGTGEGDRRRKRPIMVFFVVSLLICIALQTTSLQGVAAFDEDAIHGCGGFVESSPNLAKARKSSDPKPDYSHISVELRTLDGLVKDTVQCAPNGYYFLPVYDKGTFSLAVKGPPGWSWSPSQVTVVVDNNGCNNNDDINFGYTGFSLSGKVVGAVGGPSCAQKGKGPSGVKVSLHSDGLSQDVPSVVTSEGGDFKFVDLVPSVYRLEAQHPKFKVELKGEAEVNVGFGNVDVGEIFHVPGYTLQGSVLSQGNPVLGVHVYLYSDDISEIPCELGAGNLPTHGKALCRAVSDANGKFGFSSLPCGKYKLVPFYKGENTVFDVSPSEVEVLVNHDDTVLAEPFKVTGFSVGGRVVDSQGTGVEGVQILIDAVQKAITDASGAYKLDQVTSTKYTITAHKVHYKFSSLESFMVLPNIASLPDISATKYALCGSVVIDRSTHNLKRQIALTHGPANVKPQTKWVDENGSFCFEVPPGEYRLTPVTSQAEQLSGLVFSPSYLDITVTGPVLDVVLTQAKVSISGSVVCIGPCDENVVVTLAPVSKSVDSSRVQKTHLASGSSAFFFDNVLPGKYQLGVRHEGFVKVPGINDRWCWEESTIEKDLGTSNLENVQFRQKGFWMPIHSTHPTEASLLQPNGEPLTIQLEKGWQKICIQQSGIHKLQIIKSCTSFGLVPFEYDTSKPLPIEMVGQKHKLTGRIDIQNAQDVDVEQLAEYVVVIIWKPDGSFVDSNNRLRAATDADGKSFLEYVHWAEMGEELTFIPRDVRGIPDHALSDSPGKQFLFYPREHRVHVNVDGCQPAIPSFVGRPGLYLEGTVTPALEGVNIGIAVESCSADANLKKGDIVMTSTTGTDGSYVVGPLYDDAEYVVHASKSGYHCKRLSKDSFHCEKLGKVVVRILPGEGAENYLPSVLLSLSGEKGFRKNALTSSEEAYVFESLFPGNFFLRPLLKEYRFSPSSLSIDLESGSVIESTFTASRISYSVLGTVTSLTGKPEEGVSVEARSELKGYYEESVTDAEGKYRLRGLQPGTEYTIRVALREEGLPKIERASPSSYSLKVGTNDTTAVDFVVFDRPLTTIISGTVEGADVEKWQKHMTIWVTSAGGANKIEKVVPLPLSHYFEIQGLPHGRYTVQLLLGLSGKTHRFESDSVDVDLGHQPQVHVGPLRFIAEEKQHKQDLASAPVLPVLVGLLVITMAVSMPRLMKEGQQWVNLSGLSNTPAAPLKKDRVVRKRTY